MDTGLEDKVVVVTGASGGIGSAVAREFAGEGARLVLHGHSRMERAEKLAGELSVDCMTYGADLTDPEEVELMFDKITSRFGPPNCLVANAGIWPEEEVPIQDMSLDRWQNTITTDQTSVFLCSREYFRILQSADLDRASLVIVGSTAAVFGEENHADYSAAKAAVTYGLTRSLKNEIVRIAPKGRVNAICPGWTKTDMAESGLDDPASVRETFRTRSIESIGKPEDMARTIVFLSSHRLAGHITGEIVTVAGGMEGRLLHREPDVD